MFLGSVPITVALISISVNIKLVFRSTCAIVYTAVTTDRASFNW